MDWKTFIKSEKQKDYCKRLMSFVNSEYANYACFPPKNQIYNAFSLTPFDSVKVVILGQDPYHNAGQAVGLAFSVDKKTTIPRSLRIRATYLHGQNRAYCF